MREHACAIASNTDFRDAADRDMGTGRHTPSLRESCRSDGTCENQQVRGHSNRYRAPYMVPVCS